MRLALQHFKRVAFLSPHPDDVELCCGILITRLLRHGSEVAYYCITDGAPSSKLLTPVARPPAHLTRPQYAAIRRKESLRALRLMGVPSSCIHFLGYPDLESYKHIASIVDRLAEILPFYDTVVCCPFEGGHPDHDVTRFSLACACRRARFYPELLEYASYNSRGYQRFLHHRPRQVTLRSTRTERHLKRRIIRVFASQKDEAILFRDDLERFRPNTKVSLARFHKYRSTPHYERFTYRCTVILAAIKRHLASHGDRPRNMTVRAGDRNRQL
jgi:LmbE family N-acetylglucosaminyl deacetylase